MKFLSLSLVIAMAGCAHPVAPTPPAPYLPPQDMIKEGVDEVLVGLSDLEKECDYDAKLSIQSQHLVEAEELIGECAYLESNANIDQILLQGLFDDPDQKTPNWKPEYATRAGCYVPNIQRAYKSILSQVVKYGYQPSQRVSQGMTALDWLRAISDCTYKAESK